MKSFWKLGLIAILGLVITSFFVFSPFLIAQQAPSFPGQSQSVSGYTQLFQQAMSFILARYVDEPDPQKLFEGAMKGMLEALQDPFSAYLTESDFRGLTDTTQGEFGGVGLFINKMPLSQIKPDGPETQYYVEIVSPIDDTPAHRAGILAGDYITAIDGESVKTMEMDEVLRRLRGRPGTNVRVTILRHQSVSFDVTLTRAIIEVPSVRFQMLDNIGYMRIMQFTSHAPERVEEALKNIQNRNPKALIIDLRSNPGGLLNAVVQIADFFFTSGNIVSTRSRNPRENQSFDATQGYEFPQNIPIVVLIDKGSASASEILAGALKDRNRAYLVGETTYGKGSVQQVIPFSRTGFRLTTARYFTPAGISIDKTGVKPHQEIKEPDLNEAERESFRKLMDSRRIESLVSQNKNPTTSQIESWIVRLQNDGYRLDRRWIRRLIQNEVNRVNNVSPPSIDLDFDVVLAQTLELLKKGEIPPR